MFWITIFGIWKLSQLLPIQILHSTSIYSTSVFFTLFYLVHSDIFESFHLASFSLSGPFTGHLRIKPWEALHVFRDLLGLQAIKQRKKRLGIVIIIARIMENYGTWWKILENDGKGLNMWKNYATWIPPGPFACFHDNFSDLKNYSI